jgi:hypothetical protein
LHRQVHQQKKILCLKVKFSRKIDPKLTQRAFSIFHNPILLNEWSAKSAHLLSKPMSHWPCASGSLTFCLMGEKMWIEMGVAGARPTLSGSSKPEPSQAWISFFEEARRLAELARSRGAARQHHADGATSAVSENSEAPGMRSVQSR